MERKQLHTAINERKELRKQVSMLQVVMSVFAFLRVNALFSVRHIVLLIQLESCNSWQMQLYVYVNIGTDCGAEGEAESRGGGEEEEAGGD